MKLSDLITGIVIAGAIAAGTVFFIAPKLKAQPAKAEPSIAPSGERPGQASGQALGKAQSDPTEMRRNTVLSQRSDGHYWARALVNQKTSVDFMVDTGASIVALTYKDAQRMGLKPDTLDYKWTINTAGGETKGASVLIESLKINQVHIRDVEAMVLRSDLEQSLLGMSFLNKLYSYEFRGDRLIIRQ